MHFQPAMRARKTDRLTLESELRRALDREEITLLYQPIVRLEDRTVAGFEALPRWEARERPIIEHTQEMSERLGDMNYWPDEVRSQVMKTVGASPEIGALRGKTALHAPTATVALNVEP